MCVYIYIICTASCCGHRGGARRFGRGPHDGSVHQRHGWGNHEHWGLGAGLGAFVHSTNLPRTLRLVHQLNAGTIQINGAPTARENAPFGGQGMSGYGREGGYDGLAEFIRVKNVAIG